MLQKAKSLRVCVRQVTAYDWQMHALAGGSTLKYFLPWGPELPSNTTCHSAPRVKWNLNPSNGLTSGHECDRQTTDRQTDGQRNV